MNEQIIKKAERKVGWYVVGAIVVLVAVFFAGTKYAANGASSNNQAAAVRGGNGGRTFTRNGANGIFGTIIKKDQQSITVQMQDGSSKIVFVDSSTRVSKTVSGSLDDAAVGAPVSVNGTPNSDGSITAQNIQLRSASDFPQTRMQTQ